MPATTNSFIEQLKKSRALSEDRLAEFGVLSQGLKTSSQTEIAIAAVRHRFLTRFQAEEILNGRARRLIVGDYRLTDIIGYGGMGTVYSAKHAQTGNGVAIKLLGEQYKHDAGMRTRFQLEGKSGMKIDHPKLVKTLELGVIEDLYGETDYMAMELFEGVTLLEGVAFSQGPMKYDAASDVICQAAEGLGYLHKQGMVHRDVKPDNILIDMDGNAKILDFGLTLAALDDEFSLSMIFGHDCLGTADFIPPEQSLDSFNVDQRADIYSLGCSLFTAVTSQRPFPYPTRAATVKAHRIDPRPRAEKFNPIVPERLGDIIEKMMAINPNDRYPSMEIVAHRLRHFRRQRNWSFKFNQVLALRHKQKQKQTVSKLQNAQSQKPTTLNAKVETDSGKKPLSGEHEIHS